MAAVCTALLTRPAAFPGTGGSPGAPAPGTPSPSFSGSETLGAGLESLRAPSHQSADDPEAGPQLPAFSLVSTPGILFCEGSFSLINVGQFCLCGRP